MLAKQTVMGPAKKSSAASLRSRTLTLFVSSVLIIFVAEALVMLLLPDLMNLGRPYIAFIDATLLSLIVVPALYLLFFKPMQASIHSLERSEQYQEQLKEVGKVKNDFISIAAHELCTPLSSIMGYIDLMLTESVPAHQKQYLEVIYQKTLALERIIDDLLVLNRYQTGDGLQINREEQDLLSSIQTVVSAYRISSPDQPIHLDLPASELVFSYDPVRISQVLDNLLSNAIKYSNDVHDRIDLTVTEQEQQVTIQIRDEGIGMTPKELKQIYQKFYRAETDKLVVAAWVSVWRS